VTQDSTFAVAGGAMEHAQKSGQNLSQLLVVNVSDTLTSISNTSSNQQNIVTSFNALMKKVMRQSRVEVVSPLVVQNIFSENIQK
jgi:hypothetical protein